MTRQRIILGLLAAAAVGVGAYAAGVVTRPATPVSRPADAASQALMNWLQVPVDQQTEIEQHDPTFAQNLKSLREALAARRLELAAALDDTGSSDNTIRARLDALLSANANLEHRIADYLLTVRHHLTPQQQRRLFGLCAEGVRQGPNCPCRYGPDGIGRGQGGQGRGLGPRPGRGLGAGANP